jgi:hypothetical protein
LDLKNPPQKVEDDFQSIAPAQRLSLLLILAKYSNDQLEIFTRFVIELLQKPWWYRFWMIQKVLLAQEIEVICDDERLALGKIRSMVEANGSFETDIP